MNVLVVDDHEINRIVLLYILQKLGYSADLATNGQEALQATQVKPYQLIFMDIQMPLMDGKKAAEKILESVAQPPYIIAMSANTSVRDKKDCLALGMVDYIEKPLDFEKIKQILIYYSGQNIQQTLLE
ncbi:response regulator [Paenibacillus sp. FSL M7-0802]|uniref:response regulator n=1 Tax=Paenibacillus sp. FSL M7-0802 TaxID=2921536 RepID=UPI0030FBBB5A